MTPEVVALPPPPPLPCCFGPGQCSCECGLVHGIPVETEVLVGVDQSGDRWRREKCCGFRGDLFADFRALFSAGWQGARTEGALDSLMLGSWLDFRT